MSPATLPVGPVEWVAIAFPGQTVDAAIVPPLVDLVGSGAVRIIDVIVLQKHPTGAVRVVELEDLDIAAFDAVDGDVYELLNQDDIAQIGADLEPDSTALVLVWENRWAAAFAESVRAANGALAAHARIPHAAVAEAVRAVPTDEGVRL